LTNQIASRLASDPSYLGQEFPVTGAEHVHREQPRGSGSSGPGLGVWLGVVLATVCIAASGTAAYTKRDRLGQAYRAARRQVRSWRQLEDEDDYENEGHTYGQDDQGGMFVSNTETTYELEGMSIGAYEDPPGSPTDHTIQQVYMPSPKGEGQADAD